MTPTLITYHVKKIFYYKVSFLFFIFLCTCNLLFAQYTLRINIKSLPETHSNDSVFIAGSFNGWNPGNTKYALNKKGDTFSVDITGLQKDVYQFKFTRGNWDKVEVTDVGKGIENRLIKLDSDTTIDYSIAAWADDFAQQARQHTASSNVHILDTAFLIPQLQRTRRIWIYLPPGYAAGKKKYPVLYMHDGQNLFDDATSGFGEWGVDECLDSLIKKGNVASIVVGIDNGSKRITEYNPYDYAQFGKGEGNEYVRFLAETLKPYIDKHYRTLASKENTFIAGSSLGGLISYYAMLKYPAVFGKAGIFSPSFWIAPGINDLTDSVGSRSNGQFFFFMGELEGDSMLSDMKRITDKLGENSGTLIYSVTDPDGRHNEKTWRKWFEEFYLWITGNGLSYQIKSKD